MTRTDLLRDVLAVTAPPLLTSAAQERLMKEVEPDAPERIDSFDCGVAPSDEPWPVVVTLETCKHGRSEGRCSDCPGRE